MNPSGPSALPLHPGPGGPGQELRERRAGIVARLGEAAYEARCRELRVEAAGECLALTGAPPEAEAWETARAGKKPSPAFAPVLAALDRVALKGQEGAALDAEQITTVHALSLGEPPPSMIRTIQTEPQFPGGSLSPPQTIGLRLGELLEWLGGPSGQELVPAPRAGLFFARFLEISPFLSGNFRVAHILLSHFSIAGGYPPIWFRRSEAVAIREEVSRAFRFDTAPLVTRIENSIRCSLDLVESC